MNTIKKLKLLFLLLFVIAFSVPKSVFAVQGCCNVNGSNGRPNIVCGTGTACPSGQLSCEISRNTNADIDGDGSNDTYNPDCFIVISPPESVRITDFGKLFSGAVAVLLLAAFILAFFFLILGGMSWLTSGGDKAAVEAARNKIIAALIGLVIVAATWALFQLVGGAIGYNILGGFQIPTLF